MTPVDGGTVSTGTGDASEAAVVVPAGAVDENTVLQVAAISATDPNLPPLPVNTLPLVFRFTPDGFVFNTTVTLNITYSDSQIVGFPESTLVPYLVVGDTVVQVAPCLDPDAPDPRSLFCQPGHSKQYHEHQYYSLFLLWSGGSRRYCYSRPRLGRFQCPS